VALRVSDAGQVVGYGTTSTGASHGFSWTAQTGTVDMGTLGGASSIARAVNFFGLAVGSSNTPTENHAFAWAAWMGMVDLGTLGGTFSQAVDVNIRGEIVGDSSTAGDTADHAALWVLR
jgi:probable HAF family extracellular repeat protein